MAVTGTKTNGEICTNALWKCGVVGMGDTPEAEEMALALSNLDMMLKSWQARGYNLWTLTEQTVNLTTAASYTLSPVRPLKVQSVRFVKDSISSTMQEFTREEYDSLPNKATTGRPTCWYYDRQREAALLYVWPVLSVAASETLAITYEREIEDVDENTAADVPGEWWEAVVYGLAARLMDDYNIDRGNVRARATHELNNALAFDREGSVYFGEAS